MMSKLRRPSVVSPSLAFAVTGVALVFVCTGCEALIGADFDDYGRTGDGAPDDAKAGGSDAPRSTDGNGRGGTGTGGTGATGGSAVGGSGGAGATGGGTTGSGGAGATGGTTGSGGLGGSAGVGGGSSADAAGGRGGAGIPPLDASVLDAASDQRIVKDATAQDATGGGGPGTPDAAIDTGPPPPRDGGTAGGVCTPGQVNSIAACGNCGLYLQTCNAQGVWDPPFCQQDPAACGPGSIEHRGCETNGTQVATCTSTCTWSLGACVHPACTAGQMEEQPCSLCGKQTRSCQATDAGGQWGPFSACSGQGICAAGTSDVTPCGNCGTHSRACTASCAWDAWGACQGEGPCAAGDVQTEACLLLLTRTRVCIAGCRWGEWGSCL